MNYQLFTTAMVATCCTAMALAEPADSVQITETQKSSKIEFVKTANDTTVYNILQKDRSMNTNEIQVPHFAIHTLDNKFVMTIGGQINPIIGYDLGNDLYGNPDAGINFVPAMIPVPPTSGKHNNFFLNAFNACIDLQIVGFGGTKNQITGYIKFATDGNGKALELSKAYITWMGLRAGMMHTIFSDESVIPPTIDPQGPNALVAGTFYEIGYESASFNGFKFGVALGKPTYNYSHGKYYGGRREWHGENINGEEVCNASYYNQLVPDVPMYIEWAHSDLNRIRLSGIVRTLAYRDMLTNSKRHSVGWGVQLTGNYNPVEPLIFYAQAIYGKGIGAYIQDLQGQPLSYLPENSHPGKMTPTPAFGWTFAATYNISEKWQVNLMGSQVRIWKAAPYAIAQETDGTIYNYKYAYYGAANVFFNISSYFQVGLEYVYGYRKTWNAGGASDNRLQMQFMFAL